MIYFIEGAVGLKSPLRTDALVPSIADFRFAPYGQPRLLSRDRVHASSRSFCSFKTVPLM
jgi:hypothetical protein